MTFTEFVLSNEPGIRLGFFFGIFGLMALWEILSPRRPLLVHKAGRWFNNIGLVVLNSLILRVVFPTAAVGMALFASEHGWGIFNTFSVPIYLVIPASVIILDLIVYLQHVMVHAVPALWRLHRVHHADLDFDVTTGARFHPIEILLSMVIKFAAIAALGAPPVAVLLFEVVLNGTAMFNHANISLPPKLDRALRWFLVTPDMHRVHHSWEVDETNSNFGFNLTWWDRLFGTYRKQPRAGHDDMVIGLKNERDPAICARLPALLLMPFRGQPGNYAINRRFEDD